MSGTPTIVGLAMNSYDCRHFFFVPVIVYIIPGSDSKLSVHFTSQNIPNK